MILTREQLLQAYTDSGGAGPFFTSDHHHNHRNVIEYSDRPWTFENQTAELVDRWNARVGIMDDVYHLGDFSFHTRGKIGALVEIIESLNGVIHFIRGNHCDYDIWERIAQRNIPHVAWIKDYYHLKVQGQPIELSHYPFETWRGAGGGSWMLHGHCHGTLPPRGKRLDCGIDNHPDRQIFSYAEVAAHMAKQEFVIVDHHTGVRP